MSNNNLDSLLSSGSSTRGDQIKGSASSEAVSPTTSLRSRKLHARCSSDNRPPVSTRSKSEQPRRPKGGVQTIEEGVVHHTVPSQSSIPYHRSEDRAGETFNTECSESLAKSAGTSHSSQRNHMPFARPLPPNFERGSSDSVVSYTRKDISWARSHSGGIWHEKQKRTTPRDDSSSTRSHLGKTTSEHRSSTPIVPLQPPQSSRPPTPQLPNIHKVKMETSFTNLRQEVASVADRSKVTSDTSRRSSINPLRIFSLPIHGFRHFSRVKHRALDETPHHRTRHVISPSEAQDHRSLLKRQQTGAVLERAATLLDSIKHPMVKPFGYGPRNLSERSESSCNSNAPRSPRNHLQHVPTSTKLSINKSVMNVGDTRSYSSSLLKLMMGPTPKSTPDEKATYKIKRSPSAETEEYLKIDISVRGETSYLPSEARRIHTPPLPEYGLNGMRRGFFFDYNAPKHDDDEDDATEGCHGATNLDSKTTSGKSAPKLVRNTTIGKIYGLQKTSRMKTADWYDAQIAELDEDIEGSGLDTAHDNSRPGRLAQLRNMQYESMLDYNIPEHLPSSPLCPCNPRYWRVVEGRGSQFRGCWMHGYGEQE